MNIRSCSNKGTYLIVFLLALSLESLPLYSQSWESWAKVVPPDNGSSKNKSMKKRSEQLFVAPLKSYQKNVSPKQGPKCPALPSCSSFTLSAMNQYGFVRGFIMGLDRIYFRENFDMKYLKHYLPVFLPGNLAKVYDPVEANNIFRKKDWTLIDPDFSYSYKSR
jgi:uncharacterized protein